jgi:enamine deaminase RidA (YjgF/YER057c/UK114 family)
MRLRIFPWLGREYVRLWGEGQPGLGTADATRELLGRFAVELAPHGLSLDDTVRTRLFAPDRAARDAGSAARREVLSNRARSVSSGLIAPAVIDSGAAVALELILLRPRQAGAQKLLREYDPPRTPLRYLVLDSLFFASGATMPGATLAEQVADTLAEHGESLAMAGLSWEKAVLISCFLHRGESVDALRQALRQAAPVADVPLEYELVEGFAGEGRLVEIEVTARAD